MLFRSKYVVDGHHVVLDYKPHEYEIAEIIAKRYGKQVQMIPRVVFPQGISTPDFLIDKEKYDLKTISGSGKSVLSDAIKKKKRQSSRFILGKR